MSTMQSEVYDAFIDAGASEPKARAAAEVIAITPKADEVASKRDIDTINHKIETLRSETMSAIETLRTETTSAIETLRTETKADIKLVHWMIGFNLAISAAILIKLINI